MPKLTLERVLVVAAFLLAALMVIQPQASDPDLYWHLRSGEVMLDSGRVITGDVFSHTLTGVLRPHHEWLSEIILIGMYRALGDYGLTLLAAIFSLTALVLMFRITPGALTVRLLLMLVAAHATGATAMARPQAWMVIFTLVLVGMVLRRKPSLRWIPVMMLAWGNLHGGWVTGYIVLGAAVVAEAVKIALKRGGDVAWLRGLILWSLIGVLALMVNPYGVEQLLVPLDTLTQAARPFIAEWLPPNLLNISYAGFTLLLLLGVSVLLTQWRRLSLLEALLLVGFGVWALTASRVVLLYTFVAPVILAPYLSEIIAQSAPRFQISEARLRHTLRYGLPTLIGLGVLVGVLFITGSRPERIRQIQDTAKFPVAAVEFLAASPPIEKPELFNSYGWGGYLIYHLRGYPVFIDGRADLYDDFFFVYQSIATAQDGWQDKLSAYNVNTILIRPDSILATALIDDPAWRLVYEDSLAVIYTRP